MSTASTSTFAAIRLIAGREVLARIRTRAFLVGTGLMLLLAVGGGIALSLIVDHDSSPSTPTPTAVVAAGLSDAQRSAITATAEQLGAPVTLSEASADRARSEVDAGTSVAAVIDSDGTVTVYSKSDLSDSLQAAIRGGLATSQIQTALADAHVDPNALAAESKVAVQRANDAPDREIGERVVIAMVGLILLTYAIMQAGPAVSTGVIEEKSSRIVEILLAAVRPGALMAGKIIGIGLVSLLQLVLIGAAALLTVTATGLLTLPTVALSTALIALVGFVLGYLFFAALFAAAGSMVSRIEDSAGTVLPVTMFAFVSVYSGLFVVINPDSALAPYLTWIPPFSVSAVPIRIALGELSLLGAVGPTALMAAATAGCIWVAARIYRHSVLYSGAKVSWGQALRTR
ncbi:ABC transporter permease [Gordonia hydrophobica]|uniref:ABC transporter permease n=1 Tax=Gordonia hydrophobica TaxID=40516 RepID=A0ABZ2U4L2_9ACTN|nr:ABC transporter permease [Gordonia hydrophobica]MBM7368215.1 ABC-2 type transport system permease protein [Gordonia hydrophobica]